MEAAHSSKTAFPDSSAWKVVWSICSPPSKTDKRQNLSTLMHILSGSHIFQRNTQTHTIWCLNRCSGHGVVKLHVIPAVVLLTGEQILPQYTSPSSPTVPGCHQSLSLSFFIYYDLFVCQCLFPLFLSLSLFDLSFSILYFQLNISHLGEVSGVWIYANKQYSTVYRNVCVFKIVAKVLPSVIWEQGLLAERDNTGMHPVSCRILHSKGKLTHTDKFKETDSQTNRKKLNLAHIFTQSDTGRQASTNNVLGHIVLDDCTVHWDVSLCRTSSAWWCGSAWGQPGSWLSPSHACPPGCQHWRSTFSFHCAPPESQS